MSKISERAKKTDAEITSASMADIAFLLIVFFMVTTVFSATKGLDFKIPADEQNQNQSEELAAITFKIFEDGSFTMDGKDAVREDIIPYIQPKLDRWPDKPLIIYSRPDAPFSSMIGVYDELKRWNRPKEQQGLGYTKSLNISIPTQREIQEYIQIFGSNPFEQ